MRIDGAFSIVKQTNRIAITRCGSHWLTYITDSENPTKSHRRVVGARSKLIALLRQRCPRCLQGKIFSGAIRMNDPCPICGLIFQREEGYFLGAIYVSSLLSFVIFGAGFFLGTWLLPDWNQYLVLLMVFVAYLTLVPAVFRYSRTVWIYFDRWESPTDTSAGAFEKARAAEFAQSEHDRRTQS